MTETTSPLYRHAFEQYLRRGIPVDVSIKAALRKGQLRITPRYLWLTSGDEKVRPSHAANDGRIFYWSDPPPTGNPGDEYGCRCAAVPYADVQDAVRLAVAVTPLTRARVVGSLILRTAIRRALGKDDAAAPKPVESANTPLPKPEGIPKDWEESVSNNGQGIRYRDPKNKHNEVRIQKGNFSSDYALSRTTYVRWKKYGQWLDKNGKPSFDPEKTHIPIDEFRFNPEMFK